MHGIVALVIDHAAPISAVTPLKTEMMVGEFELLIQESSQEATWMLFQASVMVVKNPVLVF